MKILYIITSLEMGGAEKLVVDMLLRLREKGHEVELLTFSGKRTPLYQKIEQEGVKIHHFGVNAKMYNPMNVLKLASFLKHNRYDIVHTHNTAPQLFAAIASVLCSVVLCTTEHNTSNRRRNWKWYVPLDRWMYRQYQSIVCISDQAEINLKAYLGKGKYAISTIYNGIDVKSFANAAPSDELLMQKGNRKAIVMVAGFRYEKDQDTLIKAMTYLPKNGYELWLVGDGKRRENLEQLIKNLKLEQQVKMLGLRNDVPQILKASDVVVMSSHFEGLSLSNLEGMSVGKPFIASDVDGLREVVKGYGVLFSHGNAEELASEIQHLATDEKYSQQVASKCWQRAQMFDIEKMVESYEKVYKSLIPS